MSLSVKLSTSVWPFKFLPQHRTGMDREGRVAWGGVGFGLFMISKVCRGMLSTDEGSLSDEG